MRSRNDEIIETSLEAFGNFLYLDVKYGDDDFDERANAVVRDDNIHLLLNLARSWKCYTRLGAVGVITLLSSFDQIGEVVAREGGISIIAECIMSPRVCSVMRAARALHEFCYKHKDVVVKTGGIKVLVDLISKLSRRAKLLHLKYEKLLDLVVRALSCLAMTDVNRIEATSVQALAVTLARGRCIELSLAIMKNDAIVGPIDGHCQITSSLNNSLRS